MMKRYAKIGRTVLGAALVAMLTASGALAAKMDNENDPNPHEVEYEFSEAIENVKGFVAEQRDEAYEEATAALDTADRFIERQQDRLSESWNGMSAAAREDARNAMHEIRKRRNEAAEWRGSMKAASADAWSNVKRGFEQAYEDLADAVTESEKRATETGEQN